MSIWLRGASSWVSSHCCFTAGQQYEPLSNSLIFQPPYTFHHHISHHISPHHHHKSAPFPLLKKLTLPSPSSGAAGHWCRQQATQLKSLVPTSGAQNAWSLLTALHGGQHVMAIALVVTRSSRVAMVSTPSRSAASEYSYDAQSRRRHSRRLQPRQRRPRNSATPTAHRQLPIPLLS